MSKPSGYIRSQIVLHWVIAVLILAQYIFQDQIDAAWHEIERGNAEAGFHPHVLVGTIILVLAVWRLVIRLRRGAPQAPDHGAVLNMAGKVTHVAIYALILLIPLSGLGAWFGGAAQAAEGHEIMTKLLMALIILHIAAALFHHYVLKDGLIKRMMKAG